VTTVVAKLFGQVTPDVAVFGRKDHQQLTVLRRMVTDLDMPVEIVGAPIVREPDGLAMSSRNQYLDDHQRTRALALSRALAAAVLAHRDGADAVRLQALVTAALATAPGIELEYAEVLDPDTLATTDDRERLLVAVAAHVGPARLIDNVVVGETDDEERLLAAVSR
jgi:pantoate--beta-alanine ligase